MKTTVGTLAVLTAALACAPAHAAPATVKLRVEGKTKTIFEGKVRTNGQPVTGDETGPHTCDGTNGGANPTPGPTATGALATAAEAGSFTLDASWSDDFQDFSVSRIGPDEQDLEASQFWGVGVNGQSLQVGGCQYQVKTGDEVLWAYDLFNKKHILLASGARKTRVGRAYRVAVRDGQDGTPVQGAVVGGEKTNAKGIATLRFTARGVKRLKATRDDSLRSNQLRVQVLRRKR
jgi:hypothetical protein